MNTWPIKLAGSGGNMIQGIAVPFGSPRDRDTDGDYFDAQTDLGETFISSPPVLYHHGLDATVDTAVIGRVKTRRVISDVGLWVEAQLDENSRWYEAVKKLVALGRMSFSSATLPALARKTAAGRITSWPICEISTTPTPASTHTLISLSDTEKRFAEAGLQLPWGGAKTADSAWQDYEARSRQREYAELRAFAARNRTREFNQLRADAVRGGF